MKTVLVADDSQTSHMLVEQALRRIGPLRVLAARNGLEALKLLEDEPVDLLVSDVQMPEMDGIALVRHVRTRRSSADLPIVLITAKADHEAQGEGIRLGADACVLKPISREELATVATQLLSRERNPT